MAQEDAGGEKECTERISITPSPPLLFQRTAAPPSTGVKSRDRTHKHFKSTANTE